MSTQPQATGGQEVHGEDLYLGLDCSTQALKALFLNQHGEVVEQEVVDFDNDLGHIYHTTKGTYRGYSLEEHRNPSHPNYKAGVVTTPTLMFVFALELLLDNLKTRGMDLRRVRAISASGQMHGSVYWAKNASRHLKALQPGKSLHTQLHAAFSLPCGPIWMDSSTETYCQALEKHFPGGAQELANLTGSRAYARFTGVQISKLHATHPDLLSHTERISLVSSFLVTLLLGQYAPIDFADACGMSLFDLHKRQWSSDLLAHTCRSFQPLQDEGPANKRQKTTQNSHHDQPDLAALLGEPVGLQTLGRIHPYFSERFGLDSSCEVVSASGDNCCALLGMGLTEAGDVGLSLGTSDCVFGVLQHPKPGKEGHVLVHPGQSDLFMLLLCFKNGSLNRERVRDAAGFRDWAAFARAMEQTAPGNQQQLAIRWTEPEITPTTTRPGKPKTPYLHRLRVHVRWDAKEQRVESFDPASEVRALVEGQIMGYHLHCKLMGLSEMKRVIATGGASREKSLLQVVADVFGVPVYVQQNADGTAITETAAMGAALRAHWGVERQRSTAAPSPPPPAATRQSPRTSGRSAFQFHESPKFSGRTTNQSPKTSVRSHLSPKISGSHLSPKMSGNHLSPKISGRSADAAAGSVLHPTASSSSSFSSSSSSNGASHSAADSSRKAPTLVLCASPRPSAVAIYKELLPRYERLEQLAVQLGNIP
eukprot:g42308.t1